MWRKWEIMPKGIYYAEVTKRRGIPNIICNNYYGFGYEITFQHHKPDSCGSVTSQQLVEEESLLSSS